MGSVTSIRASSPSIVMAGVKTLMFCAHDSNEHHLEWYQPNKHWLLKNKHGKSRAFVNLIAALSALENASRHHVDSFTVLADTWE